MPPSDGPPLRVARELRSLRRTRRLRGMKRSDLLYRAYVTGLFSLFGFYLALGLVDDAPIDSGTVDWIRDNAAAWIGLVAAAAMVAGVRSGASGGPLSVDDADFHHLLLSPIDRRAVLRDPTRRLLVYGAAFGCLIGLVGGELGSRRLPGSTVSWLLWGLLAGLSIALGAIGASLLASGARIGPWTAALVSSVLLGWSLLDVAEQSRTSPFTLLGEIAVWPLDAEPVALVAVALTVAAAVGGYFAIGGMSLERARRRLVLVRQVRFALAQQDIRALILLRRQLGFERPRSRPVLRFAGGGRLEDRFPVAVRALRSYLRWPARRVARVVVLAGLAGLALGGVWRGTSALVLVAGILFYLVALEVVEPFAQEIDHEPLVDATPAIKGRVLFQHLLASTGAMAVLWALAGVVAAVTAGFDRLLPVVGIELLPASAAAVAGGALSIRRIGGETDDSLLPEELVGPRAAFRLGWPPALAVLGTVPVLVARHALDEDVNVLPSAVNVTVIVAAVAAACFGWIRNREDLLANINAERAK